MFNSRKYRPEDPALVSDFLAFTPHEWVDAEDASEATLQFQAVLLEGRAVLSTDPDDVAGALTRLMAEYGHGPQYRPVADDALYGPHLRRLGTVRIAVTSRQAKFKAGQGSIEERLRLAQHLRDRGAPNDRRAADVIEDLAPELSAGEPHR